MFTIAMSVFIQGSNHRELFDAVKYIFESSIQATVTNDLKVDVHHESAVYHFKLNTEAPADAIALVENICRGNYELGTQHVNVDWSNLSYGIERFPKDITAEDAILLTNTVIGAALDNRIMTNRVLQTLGEHERRLNEISRADVVPKQYAEAINILSKKTIGVNLIETTNNKTGEVKWPIH